MKMILTRKLAIVLMSSWLLVFGWLGAIWFLSSCTGKQLSPWLLPVPNWDKVCHFIAFSAGGATVTFAMRRTWRLPLLPIIVISFLVVSCYGAVDELHQLYTPGRSGGDLYDWFFDTLGAAAGTFLTAFLYARHFTPRSRSTSLEPAPGN